ncbi:hypothetical protein, partial [Endozoicomonas sp. SESOKO1]|uniref:hypothetical protein n=1 Tax=Endozoicomonas sp. SESOKO1 TaxID=2828742 RepID=UPI0021477C6B
MASLRDKLADYQQQLKNRPMATAGNHGGNITAQQPDTISGIAPQPDTIVGKRPDDPSLWLIHQFRQQHSDPTSQPTSQPTSHPTVDVSPLISSIKKRVEMYQLFNLVLIISSFTKAIKKSFPYAAGVYDSELKQLTDQIKYYLSNHELDNTKRIRTRRTLTEELTEFLLEAVIKFETAPMTKEMKVFFKGFKERRDAFTRALYNGDTISDDPEFKEMFESMKNKITIMKGLLKYNSEIEQAIANNDYYRAGQITFRVNILHDKVQGTPDDYASENPYLDLLNDIKELETNQVDALLSLTDKTDASVFLYDIIIRACAHNALILAFEDEMDPGFCFGDILSTAIAGQDGMYSNSLSSLAKSILFGVDYSRLPVQIRIILQNILYYGKSILPENHPDSLGLNADSLYINQAIKTAVKVRDALLGELDNIGHRFNSISELIEKLLDQIPVDSLGTELVQFGVSPSEKHICYFAFSKSNNLFRLTVQDLETGVTTITGTTLEQLKTKIPNALMPFSVVYNIPQNPVAEGGPTSETGFCRLTRDALDPITKMELIRDSALTVKDIMTHKTGQLKALDQQRIRALTTKYLNTVKNDAVRQSLRIDLKSLSKSESADLAEFAKMPMVYLMREVLTSLE